MTIPLWAASGPSAANGLVFHLGQTVGERIALILSGQHVVPEAVPGRGVGPVHGRPRGGANRQIQIAGKRRKEQACDTSVEPETPRPREDGRSDQRGRDHEHRSPVVHRHEPSGQSEPSQRLGRAAALPREERSEGQGDEQGGEAVYLGAHGLAPGGEPEAVSESGEDGRQQCPGQAGR